MKGFIVVHGTSQDIASVNETTVQIAQAALAAGHRVIELGGPGSTERAIRRGIQRDPERLEFTPVDEIGLPTDYWADLLSGTLLGSGLDDIIEDILAAVRSMVRDNVTSIEFLGFSRGAVAIALALERLEKEREVGVGTSTPIRVCLLDPVPGPYGVPQEASIPSFVQKCLVLFSKHEGRPGFSPLAIQVSPKVKFESDLLMGVHGDIGGSTRSDMTRLVRDQVARFLELPSFRLSGPDRLLLQLMISIYPRQYTHPAWYQWISRRGIGWSESGEEHEMDTIEFPSVTAAKDWMHSPALHSEDQLQHLFRRVKPASEFSPPLQLIPRPFGSQTQPFFSPRVSIPNYPVIGYNRRVQFTPSTIYPSGSPLSRLMARALRLLRK